MRWVRKKSDIAGDGKSFEPERVRDDRTTGNGYSPKYILRLFAEKNCYGKAFFYFRNASDYIALYPNGQLNVRGGKEDMFRAWGNSEFRNLNPHSVFQEFEDKIIKINFIPATGEGAFSFNSYGDFISWLTGKVAQF